VRRALLALALLGVACGGGAGPDETPAPAVEGDRVSIPPGAPQLEALRSETARARSPAVRRYSGRLAWDDDVTVRVYPPVAGRVLEVKAAVGDRVVPGQILAVISSPDFGQAQAEARAADGALDLAQRTLARVRDLYEHGAGPKKDVDAAEADLERARAEQQRTRARLKLYGGIDSSVDELLRLRSAVGGTVAERSLAVGQEIRPDQMLASEAQVVQPLFVVTDPSRLWVWLDVSEVDLATLKPGQVLGLRTSAYPDRDFAARVDLVGPSLDPSTRTVRVRGSVANPDGALKAEMYVTAEVTDAGGPPPGVEVPAKALFLDGDQRWVFVEEAPGRFRRQAVAVGPEREGWIAVTEGLAAGDRVVTEGSLLLQQMLDAAAKH
jgi:membrane fusion protein, heavy metal efflux system